jgi:hypothetical protein
VLVGGLIVVAGVAFAQFYIQGSIGRGASFEDMGSMRLMGQVNADLSHPLLRPLPPTLRGAALALTFTQTHGYLALSLALNMPFKPCWGVCHSYFLHIVERRLTGRGTLQERGYPDRLEQQYDWSLTQFWHTTYTWFASDVSFPGTIVLVALVGRLFAKTWVETLPGDNPYAAGLFVLIVTILYYLPTNNIVLGQPSGFMSFWLLLLLWQSTRRRVQVADASGTVVARSPEPIVS